MTKQGNNGSDAVPAEVGAISRAAEWAVTNKFLTALTRLATPVCIAAVGWAYTTVTTLVAEQQIADRKIVTLEQRATDMATTLTSTRGDLATARERIAQLQAEQQSSAMLGRRLDEFRQDLRDIRMRLDQLTGPSFTPRYNGDNIPR